MHERQLTIKKERLFRIVATIILVCAGLLVLNHAMFSFWVSGGPPNDYPQIWYQRGIVMGWRALLLIALGVLIQFSFSTLKKSWFVRGLLVVLILGNAYPYLREFILIDRCLDSGGSWSKEYFECKLA